MSQARLFSRALPIRVFLALALAGGLAACSTGEKDIKTTKVEPDEGKSRVKIGQPYQVKGVWYYPKADPEYDETGIASWYGNPFHGQATANGETYDMDTLTAAHKTLPMPSYVKVTNLENGRALTLKVNDRGPFVNGRIIDVSRRAARLLGFYESGVARVRVQVVGGDWMQTGAQFVASKPVTPAAESKVAAAPLGTVSSGTLAPPPGVSKAPPPPPVSSAPLPSPTPAPAVGAPAPSTARTTAPATTDEAILTGRVEQGPPAKKTGIFVQFGAFSTMENAERLRVGLANRFGAAKVAEALVNGKKFYRVRVGPLADVAAADKALDQAIAMGQTGARIVVD